jgi:AcrR family transcriptional regulator
MPNSTADRHAALRDRLVGLAESQMATGGIRSLRARDLAREASCAVGAIYTVFDDLGDIVLAVNIRTFARLGAAINAADHPRDPAARLVAMAAAYHAFARDNRLLWRALFDLERPPGARPPEWYMDHMETLLALIEAPLAELMPDTDLTTRRHLARTLFGSVHGVVHLSLDEAGAGLPRTEVDGMIALLLHRFAGSPP